MNKIKFALRTCVCVVACLAFGAASARADFLASLSVEVTPEAGGLTRYVYTLDNLAASTLSAVDFALSVSPDAALADIFGPDGWLITYQTGDRTIDFLSLSEDTDLLPGSRAQFSLTSPLGSIPSDFVITGFDPTTVTIDVSQGQIAGPGLSAVPEPSGIVLVGTAVLGMFGIAWRLRAEPIA